jgi:putative membrane-bound dehydrogenase-like protein
MFRIALIALLLASTAGAAEPTHTVKLNGHTFTLPEGFTIEVAAGSDMAPRPIVASFDEKGRLYVCDSSGSNDKVAEQVKNKPHRIVRLESTKGDGKFDKQTVFVKNVMFPEGCMFLNGSLYVAAPPHIWKFTDTDDDGVADKEEIWFDGKTLTNCANDLHGPYRGPDGWIYWCKGAFAKQEYTLPNGKKFTTRASHIFRAKPDGTGLEPVMTGGMDNPVDAVFTPGGDIIFSTTFLQHPAGGKRDGLIHAVYGAVYGKDHDPVYEHPWTFPTLMPPMTHLGPAAPCGLHRYESDQFGKDYANNIFCCQFNMRKVSRHVLVPKGSTYETKDSDFVVSDNIDFHPTDVIEDADGSLLILDTGGWYKLCCPTSQLVKPDVTGAIYRVKKVGAHKIDDPRGLKIDWKKVDIDELTVLMDDLRPAVRVRAADTLVKRGEAGIKRLAKLPHVVAYREETWRLAVATLAGVDHPEARKAARLCLGENIKGDLAMIGIHAAGLWRDKEAVDDLRKLLSKGDASVKRAAATALGRIGEKAAIFDIFDALTHDNDRTLDHALTYALIEIGDAKTTAKAIHCYSLRVRRAVLAALENIPDSGLDAKAVLAELDAKDASLRETAWWIAGRHPQWGEQLAGYFKDKLKTADKLKPEERDELADRMAKFAKSEVIQKVLGEAAPATPTPTLRLIFRAMSRSGLKALPDAWGKPLAHGLVSKDVEVVRDVIGVLRAVPTTHEHFIKMVKLYEPDIVTIPPHDAKWPEDLPVLLAAAIPEPGPLTQLNVEHFVGKLHKDSPAPVRSAVADYFLRLNWEPAGLIELAAALKNANPLELSKLLGVFAKSTDEKVGLAFVKALRDPAVRPSVRAEIVKPILEKYPKTVQAEAEKLYAELAEARKGEREKLEKMLTELKPGDIRRGQLVFNNAKTQCIACHKVGYVGGTIGPDLTTIGRIRTERDLLESIVFPSASFVRSYEPVRVVTTDERTFNGILKKDAPDEIIIIVAADKEERVARADIASISPSSVSLMPSGLDQQLTPQDLADLVAFLKACK